MIYFAMAIVVIALAYVGRDWIKHRRAQHILENAMAESMDKEQRDKASLPNPERDITQEERDETLRRIADLGDRKL